MLNKEIPFIRIVAPICCGIVVGLWVSPGTTFFIVAALITAAVFLVGRYFRKSIYNPIFGLASCLAFFLIGLFLYTKQKEDIHELPEEERIYVGILEDYPLEKPRSHQLELRLRHVLVDGETLPVKGKVLVYNDTVANEKFIPGNILIFRLTPLKITNRGNPCEFDYKFYMENQGYRHYGFSSSEDIIDIQTPEKRKFRYLALIFREKLLNIYRHNGIEGEKLAIIAAITLGEKGLLEPVQKEIFSKAGIMHIMAVSGLHAGIVALLVSWLFFFLRGKLRPIKEVISIASLWVFAFITGLSPSVMRSALMFSFLIAGRLIKRPVNPINSLLASAFVLMIASPSVIFSASFQLSYMAVFYIISFEKHLAGIFDIKNPLPAYLWRSASTTITAQAGTLPLTITFFNRFPTWFIFTNVLILPVATMALIAGFITLLTSPLHIVSTTVAGILDKLIGLTEDLTRKAAALPLSTIDNVGMTVPECIVLTVAITLLFRYLTDRKRLSPLPPLAMIALFTSLVTIKSFIVANESKIIVYNTIDYSTTAFQTGKNLVVFSDSSSVEEVKRHKATLGLEMDIVKLSDNPVQIKSLDKKVLITGKINGNIMRKLEPDIVVLKGKNVDIADEDYGFNHPEAIVISEEVYLRSYQKEILRRITADTLHSVSGDGAFIASAKQKTIFKH
ncbi:MAG: ComEC/Rec2 family competence protein [Bacteroidales bacterium]